MRCDSWVYLSLFAHSKTLLSQTYCVQSYRYSHSSVCSLSRISLSAPLVILPGSWLAHHLQGLPDVTCIIKRTGGYNTGYIPIAKGTSPFICSLCGTYIYFGTSLYYLCPFPLHLLFVSTYLHTPKHKHFIEKEGKKGDRRKKNRKRINILQNIDTSPTHHKPEHRMLTRKWRPRRKQLPRQSPPLLPSAFLKPNPSSARLTPNWACTLPILVYWRVTANRSSLVETC